MLLLLALYAGVVLGSGVRRFEYKEIHRGGCATATELYPRDGYFYHDIDLKTCFGRCYQLTEHGRAACTAFEYCGWCTNGRGDCHLHTKRLRDSQGNVLSEFGIDVFTRTNRYPGVICVASHRYTFGQANGRQVDAALQLESSKIMGKTAGDATNWMFLGGGLAGLVAVTLGVVVYKKKQQYTPMESPQDAILA